MPRAKRKFDGKTFEELQAYLTKSESVALAKEYRKLGYLVRVTHKESGVLRYIVWVRYGVPRQTKVTRW